MSVRTAVRKKRLLATAGGLSAMTFQKFIISRGVLPAAISAALIAPADVPESTIGRPAKRGSFSSSS